MKVLILGGYGVFGGRLADLLSDLAELELVIAGRSLPRAKAFCVRYQGRAQVRPLALDRADIVASLQAHAPDLVVDASGPFQDYGADRYRVIAACIAAKIDYLDFADAADFVLGVSQFDAAARAAGVFVLSGVSSFPVLTAAVLRAMAKHMDLRAIEGGIAPSPFAGIGLNVMRAVLGYTGAPVKLWRDGKLSTGIGLAESLRFTIAVPGRLPLRAIRFSLVEVPDLQLIPPEYARLKSIWMGAGPLPEALLRSLNLLAKARARFGLPSFAPMAPLFHWVLNRMRFGEHRGGMFVQAHGEADGKAVAMSWHLLAEGDDGPYIPSMAIEAIVRKLLAGTRPDPGARPATHGLELEDYDALFRGKTIFTGFRKNEPAAPLYAQLLGSAFADLPPRLQELHGLAKSKWSGFAEVRRGRNPLARMIAAIIGFPNAGPKVSVSVEFTPEQDGELWTRNFAGKTFSSLQTAGQGKERYLMVERFGIVSVALALVLEKGRLALIPRSWRVGRIPMPKFLLPSGSSFEHQEQDRFCFDVNISAPLVGLIVAYRGTLEPQTSTGR